MKPSSRVENVLEQHKKLLRTLDYHGAVALLKQALADCYQESPVSIDVALLLDELAIDFKDLEDWDEAALCLAQSLAIKKLIFGPTHCETELAAERVDAASNFGPPTDQGMNSVSKIGNKHLEHIWQQNLARTHPGDVPPQLVRCLVIAKKPDPIFFGTTVAQAEYVVALKEGQIGMLSSKEELQLGDEVEARPIKMSFGSLLLAMQSKTPKRTRRPAHT